MLDLSSYPWKNHRPRSVIGIDEVGRGCLAGPVHACAVLLNFDHNLIGLTDSKLLSAKKRDQLFDLIPTHARVSVASADVSEIESLNILQASFLAMRRALHQLNADADSIVLVDGHLKIPGISFEQICLVKGDLRAEPIAAASIMAKVTRDRLMADLDEAYPGYGFKTHKGYGTKDHRDSLLKLGPCAQHRLSFKGVVPNQSSFHLD